MEHNETGHILFVDNHRDYADSTAMFLRNFGYEVKVAYSTEEAETSIQQCPPLFIIIDIDTPPENGWAFVKRMTSLFERKPIWIALTGLEKENVQRSKETGVLFHLIKPVESDLLLLILKHFNAIPRKDI